MFKCYAELECNVNCSSVTSEYSPRKWSQYLMLTVRARLGLGLAQLRSASQLQELETEQESCAQQAGGSGLLNSTAQRLHVAYRIASLTLHSSWFKPTVPEKATITVHIWHASKRFKLAEMESSAMETIPVHAWLLGVMNRVERFHPPFCTTFQVILQTFCFQDSTTLAANGSAAAFSRVTFKYYLLEPTGTLLHIM